MTARPTTLEDMIGQEDVRRRVTTVFVGSKLRGVRPPHVLFSGPAGHGKTTFAKIVATIRGGELIATSGPLLSSKRDVVGLLLQAKVDDVVFIDEVHRLATPVEEVLYEAMEDQKVSIVTGQSTSARAVTMDLEPFVLVGATTMPGRLSGPFRDRFGLHESLQPYSIEELGQIVRRGWGDDLAANDLAALEVAKRSRGVPRIALHLAERVLDWLAVNPVWSLQDPDCVAEALESFGIDGKGLDEVDLRVLTALVRVYSMGPVGLDALAQAADVDVSTIEREHEANLVRAGYIVRTPRGRMATKAALELVQGRVQ